jgi:hypothetical protein
MKWAARQRMEFIKNTLTCRGVINRSDIIKEFGISVPQASIDLKNYQELYPDSIRYNIKAKRYEATL